MFAPIFGKILENSEFFEHTEQWDGMLTTKLFATVVNPAAIFFERASNTFFKAKI